MSGHKFIDKICVCITVLGLIITILFMNGEALGIRTVVDEDSEAHEDQQYFSAKDLNGDWDSSSATVITLEGSTASVSGSGAYVYDGDVVISNSGYYVISGTLSGGSIIVDSHKNSKVWILLDGVSVYAPDDAALRVDQADKVFLTLAEGTENVLESGSVYSAEALEDGTSAVIFAKDDLTVNGSGSLYVSGGYKHGIKAKDDFIITGGTITITAAGDGINANDSIRICGADITVVSGNDGIDQDDRGGYLYVESGTLTITCADDGVRAAGDIILDGGVFEISSSDEVIHSETSVYVNEGFVTVNGMLEGIEGHNTTAGGDSAVSSDDAESSDVGTSIWWAELALAAVFLAAGLVTAAVYRDRIK